MSNLGFKAVLLTAVLFSQLFLSEIFLYQDRPEDAAFTNKASADSSDPWYNTSWLHRKRINISGNAAALTNYQIKVAVSYVSGKMNADFSDLRFANSDGTALYNYYIESKTDSVSADVWVKLPSIPTAGTYFYMYYGNSAAGSLSNGTNTFDFFDHFTSIDAAKWTKTGYTRIENGTDCFVPVLMGGGSTITSASTFGPNTGLVFRAQFGYDRGTRILGYSSGSDNAVWKTEGSYAAYLSNGSGNQQNTYGTGYETGYHIWEIDRSADAGIFKVDGNTLGTLTSYAPAGNLPVFFSSSLVNETYIWVDWVGVRKFSSVEPSPTILSEESYFLSPLSDWGYRKAITIDSSKVSGTGNLSNFPVLVNLPSDSGLASRAKADGSDIIFVPSNIAWNGGSQSNMLNYEIEKYDSATGSLQAWVKIPTLYSSNNSPATVIYMYYGNSTASSNTAANIQGVWDSNYKGVWHMNQDPSGTAPQMKDSTSYGNNGTSYGAMTTGDVISGKIGSAIDLDGNDYLSFPQALLNGRSQAALSLWFKTTDSSGSLFSQYNLSGSYGHLLNINSGTVKGGFVTSNEYDFDVADTAAVNNGSWHYAAMTYDGSNIRLYVDGIQKSSAAMTGNIYEGSTYGNYIGVQGYGNVTTQADGFLTGVVDEARISIASRSADWIKTEYNNQSDPAEFLAAGIEEVSSPATLSSWQYRKTVTIDHTKVNSDLANFPVLIDISSDSDLSSHTQADGEDILFTLSSVDWETGNQNNKLAHEIEDYDSATGSLQAWINIPSLSSTTDTVIYMYYGNGSAASQQNKTAVWDGNTKMVQHLSEFPANGMRGHYDSTQYRNDGTPYNFTGSENSTTDAVGKIAGADIFNGADGYDYINCGSDNSLNITERITLEAWMRVDADASYQSIMGKGGFSDAYWFAANPTIGHMTFYLKGVSDYNSYGSSVLWDLGGWSYVVATYDSTSSSSGNMRIYIDGILKGSQTVSGTIASTTGSVKIGNNDWYAFNGSLDEVRISNTARSAEWISTQYSNQSSPSTFLSLSSEQSLMDHFVVSGSAAQTAGASQAVTVTAINAYGSVNVEYSGDRSITLTGANSIGAHIPTFADKNGAEVQFGSSGSLSFINGVATTSIKLYKSENISIDATDGTYDSAGDSSYDLDVAVNPAALNSFDVVFPAGITSETPFSLTITAQDAYSNPTASVADPVLLSVNSGAIDVSSIASSEFSDDAVYAANVTISEIYEDKNVIFTLRNGAITQTFNIFITGVSRGSAFVPPAKPSIKNITVTVLDDGSIDFTDVPVEITQFSVSDNSSFQNSSWERLEDKGSIIKKYRTASTLYLKFRSREGAVSDTLIIHPLQEGDIVKTPSSFDVYIIKYQGGKAYKRLILSPQVFNSYRHLRWENLKTVSQEQLDRYVTSNLVYVKGDHNIYVLTPLGDTGARRTVDLQREEIDRDSIYEINEVDRESYARE